MTREERIEELKRKIARLESAIATAVNGHVARPIRKLLGNRKRQLAALEREEKDE